MRLGLLIVSLCVVVFTGCATKYKPMGWGGGYSEIKEAPDSFIVTFRGNQYTSSEEVMKYALMRAAELTLENGYQYFTVNSTTDKTKSYSYTDTHESASGAAHTHKNSRSSNDSFHAHGSSITQTKTIEKPAISLVVKCYMKKPSSDAIEAKYYLANN